MLTITKLKGAEYLITSVADGLAPHLWRPATVASHRPVVRTRWLVTCWPGAGSSS